MVLRDGIGLVGLKRTWWMAYGWCFYSYNYLHIIFGARLLQARNPSLGGKRESRANKGLIVFRVESDNGDKKSRDLFAMWNSFGEDFPYWNYVVERALNGLLFSFIYETLQKSDKNCQSTKQANKDVIPFIESSKTSNPPRCQSNGNTISTVEQDTHTRTN